MAHSKQTQTLTHEISGNGLYSQKLPFTKNKTIRNKHQNLHLNMNMRQILSIKNVVVLVFNGFYRDKKKQTNEMKRNTKLKKYLKV